MKHIAAHLICTTIAYLYIVQKIRCPFSYFFCKLSGGYSYAYSKLAPTALISASRALMEIILQGKAQQ